jgi:hypothetical protein
VKTAATPLILWTARIAFLLYAAGLAAWITTRRPVARAAWTTGFLVYLGHVFAAFQFRHHWSHASAYQETARQTAELFGTYSGAGLYLNYLFTAVWALDVIWLWRSEQTYFRRPRWGSAAIHGFMAFLFFNASVVFVSGWPRWMGLAVTVSLVTLWFTRMKRPPRQAKAPPGARRAGW